MNARGVRFSRQLAIDDQIAVARSLKAAGELSFWKIEITRRLSCDAVADAK